MDEREHGSITFSLGERLLCWTARGGEEEITCFHNFILLSRRLLVKLEFGSPQLSILLLFCTHTVPESKGSEEKSVLVEDLVNSQT